MGVRAFDERLVADTKKLLEQIALDSKPQWGGMSAPQMFAHMVTAVRYSLGMEQETKNEGGLFGAYLAAPLILNGIMKIPPGTKGPAMYDAAAPSATVDDLVTLFDTFRSRVEHQDFTPPPHPYFGNIGPRGWAKLHIVHMEHHLRQFGRDTSRYVKG